MKKRQRRIHAILLCLFYFYGSPQSASASILAWRPSAQGSIENLATGGNRVGLPTDAYSIFQNPAGSSLALNGLSFSVSRTETWDSALLVSGAPNSEFTQDPSKAFWSTAAAGKLGNFGFNLGVWTPSKAYINGETLILRETQGGFSYFSEKLKTAFGASALYRGAIWESEDESAFLRSDYDLSWSLGTLTLLPNRWFIGLSFQPPSTIQSTEEVSTPGRINLGVGFWPNRYFKAQCASMLYLSDALSKPLLQPSCGANYQALDLKATRGWFHLGSYWEPPLVSPDTNRIHVTAGFDVHLSFVVFSSGLDLAKDLISGSFSIGIDIDRLGKTLGYLPQGVSPPPAGLFPRMMRFEDDWMPAHLQMNPDDAFQEVSPDLESLREGVIQLPKVWEIPSRINRGLKTEKNELLEDLKKAKERRSD